MSSTIVNPLVSAGLVPPDLADILSTPSEDAAVSKKRTKQITGARALTANEYVEMLYEDDRKKKEEAELKQKGKEEREQRKKEKEDQKKQKLRSKPGRNKSDRIANGSSPSRRHKGTHALGVNLNSSSESDNLLAAVNDVVEAASTSRPSDMNGVQTQVLFALDARDSYLLIFVKEILVENGFVRIPQYQQCPNRRGKSGFAC